MKCINILHNNYLNIIYNLNYNVYQLQKIFMKGVYTEHNLSFFFLLGLLDICPIVRGRGGTVGATGRRVWSGLPCTSSAYALLDKATSEVLFFFFKKTQDPDTCLVLTQGSQVCIPTLLSQTTIFGWILKGYVDLLFGNRKQSLLRLFLFMYIALN